MSTFTCFRKGKIDLCRFGRSHPINQGLNPPYGEWKEVTEQDLNQGIIKLNESIEYNKDRIEELEKALNYISSKKDVLDVLNNIKEYKEDLESNKVAKIQLYLLIAILNEKTYDSNTDKEIEYKMEWGQF